MHVMRSRGAAAMAAVPAQHGVTSRVGSAARPACLTLTLIEVVCGHGWAASLDPPRGACWGCLQVEAVFNEFLQLEETSLFEDYEEVTDGTLEGWNVAEPGALHC